MHELAIAETICAIIEREATARQMKTISRAKLRIGVMNAFELEHLELSLKAYKNRAMFERASFEVAEVPVELQCTSCSKRFGDERFHSHDFAHSIAHAPAFYMAPDCPSCGAKGANIVAGKEMELVEIEGD